MKLKPYLALLSVFFKLKIHHQPHWLWWR